MQVVPQVREDWAAAALAELMPMEQRLQHSLAVEVVVLVEILHTAVVMAAVELSSLDTNPQFSERLADLFTHILFVELLTLLMCLLHQEHCQLHQFQYLHLQLNT
jgi:hypothetical protein